MNKENFEFLRVRNPVFILFGEKYFPTLVGEVFLINKHFRDR